MRRMGWQVNDEVNRGKTGKADEMNLQGGVDPKHEVMHINSIQFNSVAGS